ncbi:MAG: hypothetical protein ACREQN_06165 [Candidatus Binataceae bacterium]
MMKRFFALAIIAGLIAPASAVLAHGVVGDYTFIEPLITEDANPKNEFDILKPKWLRTSEGREFSLGFSLEKMLAPNLSVEIGSTWTSLSPKQGADVSGFDSLEIFPKYAFLTVPEHEFRLSIAADLELPTGNPSVQSQNHTTLGPVLLWAKGLGDIPNWSGLKYLRPFGLAGDFGYVPALGGHTSHDMFADQVIEYSLPYLSDNVRDVGLGWPLRNLYLFSEFNYDQLITGPSGQTFPDIRATPGIAYMGRYVQLSLATQFPLNHATAPNNHAAVLGLLDIFIDDLIPQTNWMPL